MNRTLPRPCCSLDATVALQRARQEADYNPTFRVSKADAIEKLSTARDAIALFTGATDEEKKACLTLLTFKERRQ